MVELRILIFVFLFCIWQKCEILDAASTKRKISNVCKTPACKEAASTILQSIDPKVAPCDDFYKFACGNFLKTTVIPKSDMRVDRYNSLEIKIRKQLKNSFEEPIKPNEPKWITLMKNFYKGCVDTTAIEKNGLRTELGRLKKAGGWPVLEDSWDENNFDWKRSTYALQKLGYNGWFMFVFNVVTDSSNSTKSVLNIDEPPLSIDREMFLKGIKDPIVTAYYNYMVDIAVIFGANKVIAQKELKDTLDFEIKLAKITASREDKKNQAAPSNRMTVAELTKKHPSIPWKEYFNSLLKKIVVIGDNEEVIVSVPTFFEKLENLIKETSKRVLANYLFWQAVQNDLDLLTEEVRQRKTKFEAVYYGEKARDVRSQECIQMSALLGLSNGALYIRKYFNPESKNGAEELAVDIEQQLKKIVKEADWMDEKTRTSALAKIASIKNFIGYPRELLDDKSLNEYFKKLEITPNNYLESVSNITIFMLDYTYSQLREPVNESDWKSHMDTTDINGAAQYSQEINGIDLPAGILQGVFYNKDRPQYLNYAGIGAFDLGHEITRAFDYEGGKYDKNGILKDWWTPETRTKFIEKSACIIKQYGNYTVEEVGLKVDGTRTQKSNIADNGGVKAAYLAYQNSVKQKGFEPTLPGLKYSQSQLFWIQSAVAQCSKYTPELIKTFLSTEYDSPSEFRVNGVFSNRPEFSRDFNCPVGSKMNPVKKCSVW